MTPKEQASKLIEKFEDIVDEIYSDKSTLKQCALICVEDRLKEYDRYFKIATMEAEIISVWNHNVTKQRYWQEVKLEIEKL